MSNDRFFALIDAKIASRHPKTQTTLAEHQARLRQGGRSLLSREEAEQLYGAQSADSYFGDSCAQSRDGDGSVRASRTPTGIVVCAENEVLLTLPPSFDDAQVSAAVYGHQAALAGVEAMVDAVIDAVADACFERRRRAAPQF